MVIPITQNHWTMKTCFKCGLKKSLINFYKHTGMKDGHLNKCKECAKKDTKQRLLSLKNSLEWIRKERERTRERYYRLNYKEKYKPTAEKRRLILQKYRKKYPEKYAAVMATKHLECKKGNHLHHWNYNKQYFKDVIELSISDHALLHRYLVYDQEKKIYKDLEGRYLETKQSHIDLLNKIKHEDKI